MKPFAGLLVVLAALTAACGSSGAANPTATAPPSQTVSASAPTVSALVGRWEMITTCQRYVSALDDTGLAALAPSVLAGNGWMRGSAAQLARKADICQGAVPSQAHSHFFDRFGQFGSVDQANQQVDDGTYTIVDDHTLKIGESTFRYQIVGDKLTLDPVITAAWKRDALAHPMKFSEAGWMVAVALPGYTWKRVDCMQWC